MGLERTLRKKALVEVLRVLPKLARGGIPVFLTGDFNSPSHLDWTPAVAEARADVPYAVDWPASRALANAGFGDSYRDVHPDPVADPGYTWSPGGPETRKHDFPDRIDWVLHAGPVTTVDSRLVGERGNPQVDLAFADPYPTDHRGVVSTFDVRAPTFRPLMSPARRRLTAGPGSVQVTYSGRGNADEKLAFQRRLGSPLLNARSTNEDPSGVLRLSTDGLGRGRYDVVMSSGGRVIYRTPVWVYPPGAGAALRTDRTTYRVGEAIRVRFDGAPGTQLDWVGLMRCGEVCPGPGSYLAYRYTRARVIGSVLFSADTYLGEGSQSWPLEPGRYIARLMDDDSYHAIGKSQVFTVIRRRRTLTACARSARPSGGPPARRTTLVDAHSTHGRLRAAVLHLCRRVLLRRPHLQEHSHEPKPLPHHPVRPADPRQLPRRVPRHGRLGAGRRGLLLRRLGPARDDDRARPARAARHDRGGHDALPRRRPRPRTGGAVPAVTGGGAPRARLPARVHGVHR
jgi:hypothetical protein